MNAPHLHLLITHVPVLGTLFGLCLFALAFFRPVEELKRTALLVFVFAALSAIPAYMTGESAAEYLKRLFLGKTIDPADQHAEIAAIALTLSLLCGVISLGALLFHRRGKRLGRGILVAIFLLTLIDTAFLGWTANLGGRIRHTEIVPAEHD